jgi:pilus assembly protein Flp/PilA
MPKLTRGGNLEIINQSSKQWRSLMKKNTDGSKTNLPSRPTRVLHLLKRFSKDEKGAALVEYTVLLGVMLVAVIGTIVLVGGWINTKWAALWTTLSAN